MATPQDWAPYYGLEDAAKIYLRDPIVALDQLRGVVDFPSIQSFFMTTGEEQQRHVLNASVRTILPSTITDHILTTELDGCTRNSSRAVMKSRRPTPTTSVNRSATKRRSTTGLAQMGRLLQFGRVLSRSM